MSGEIPDVGEVKWSISTKEKEALLAVANAKPDPSTTAQDFVRQYELDQLLGRLLTVQPDLSGEPVTYLRHGYSSPNEDITIRLEHQWEYNLSSREEDGDNEGMGLSVSGEHSIAVSEGMLEYSYSFVLPSDERMWPEAGHSWKIVDEGGKPLDGTEFLPNQWETWDHTNNELFIALVQRGCEDLAMALSEQKTN